MKTSALILSFLTFSLLSFSEGITFEKGSWKEAVAKANAERKIIYLDVYTSWCGPCKRMAKNYFPDEEVGVAYNKNFISISIDAEKGEGIEIAKKYNVNGYPTNLFINPQNEEIIYKTMGMPSDKNGFMKNGETAVAEKNDPMKPADYERRFLSNNYDETFLRSYLTKSKRLDLNNDKLLDVFVNKYSAKQSIDSNVHFLEDNINSVNNKGFDYVLKNISHMMYKKDKKQYTDRIMYSTIEYAAIDKSKIYFEKALKKYQALFPADIENSLYYQKEFYSKINDEKLLWITDQKYAELLSKKANAAFDQEDKEKFEDAKKGLLSQIKEMNLTEEKQKEALKNTIEANPSLSYQASSMASNQLNQIAWDIFEKKREDKILLTKALVWAKKAVDLCKNSAVAEQLPVKDTYANLLFANGKKNEAIALEKQLILMGTKEKLENMEGYEETLKKMEEGTL